MQSIKGQYSSLSCVNLPRGVAIPEKELVTSLKWIVKRQRPSELEVQRNPRARSATLRVAEKSEMHQGKNGCQQPA